jgi:hypothetical protein
MPSVVPSELGESARPGAVRELTPVLLVLLVQGALAYVVYRPTVDLYFESDAWVYLGMLRDGVWATISTAIGYHYQPVTVAWVALIRAGFGESAFAFQVVNIAQIALLAHLTYQLGRRLLPDAGIVFLGSLLVISNNAFYETAYWPLAGNMHMLAADFYLLAVIIACDVAHGRYGAFGPWLLGGTTLAAIFSHPAMITALPVTAVILFMVGDAPGNPARAGWGRAFKVLMPLVIVAVVFEVSRLTFADAVASGPRPGLEPIRAYYLASRGIVAVFSLRGSHDVVSGLMTFGHYGNFADTQLWIYVFGWIIAAAIAGAICLWRAGTGVRVLVLFYTIHLVIAAIGGGNSSRQSHVPAVPAALLTAWGLHVAARRIASAIATPYGAMIVARLPAAAILLLIVWSQRDHATSAEVHLRAATLTRALFAQIATAAPPERGPVNLTLINMPGYTIERNIGAATFANGLAEMVHMASPAVVSLQLARIAVPSAPADFANGTQPIELDALRPLVLDPSRVVVLFEKPSALSVLTPARLDSLVSR